MRMLILLIAAVTAVHAQTNEVLCKGCGVCVATCPSGAAAARHFTEGQLQAEIAEVLRDA